MLLFLVVVALKVLIAAAAVVNLLDTLRESRRR